ncbi:hypothetical protein [Oceaniradius stylonematis]|uniref:hypothetical protein n=1 Tax=Oceaniradius stylonematis TaxID=2184161 RepID=UPI00273DE84A|nr:hypothetical protein [Oceaniradius stylonematis]
MADLTITAANVVRGSGAKVLDRTAGVAITAGQTVYEAADGGMQLADCDSATAAARVPEGIALNDAAANQPVQVLKSGDITIGATLTPGTAYYQSANAGGIAPVADLATGDYPCIVGIAKSASLLSVKIHASGVAL